MSGPLGEAVFPHDDASSGYVTRHDRPHPDNASLTHGDPFPDQGTRSDVDGSSKRTEATHGSMRRHDRQGTDRGVVTNGGGVVDQHRSSYFGPVPDDRAVGD